LVEWVLPLACFQSVHMIYFVSFREAVLRAEADLLKDLIRSPLEAVEGIGEQIQNSNLSPTEVENLWVLPDSLIGKIVNYLHTFSASMAPIK